MNALIVVDVQNDFLPGGALAVPQGDEIVPLLNALLPRFDHVVATQDWHPANHGSFATMHPGRRPGDVITLGGERQHLWPPHCVQGTRGAEFPTALDRARFEAVFQKGTDPEIDSYSGFFDNGHRKATGLAPWLWDHDVDEVFIAGLATDYCVKYSALDASSLGFHTAVVVDACRAIETHPGDLEHALLEMRRASVRVMSSVDLRVPPHPTLPGP